MLYLLPVYRERERAAGAAKGAICRVKCFSLVPRAASPAYGELDFGPSRGPPPSPGHGPGQRRGLPCVFGPFGAPVARASSDLPPPRKRFALTLQISLPSGVPAKAIPADVPSEENSSLRGAAAKCPPFPSTRTAGLRASPQGCLGCLGGSGVSCPLSLP